MNAYSIIVTAALLWFSIGFYSSTHAAACDVDNDGNVDRLDLKMIASTRNTPSDGPDDSRDADGDGTITMIDVRTCIQQCSLTGCGIIDPAPPAPGKDAGRLDAVGAGPMQNAIKDSGKLNPTTSGQVGTAIHGRAIVGGTEWKVKRGDTVYSISRALFPRDTGKQARLRRDVMRLNPSVFVNGLDNMVVGAVLELPDYAGSESTTAKADQPAQATPPIPDTVTPRIAPQPVDAGPVVEPAPEKPRELASTPKIKSKSESERTIKDEPIGSGWKSTTTANEAKASASVSLAYSVGGDKLVDIGGSNDLYAGSGAHLRLGFQQMFRHGGGYRVALGLQYNLVHDSGGNTTYRDAYLQLAYQYRSDPLVYGIGAVVHTGATLEEVSTREYDAAAGAVVYLENVGNSALAGWGLSYTYLEIEEINVAESIDASRAELYYSWRF